MKSRATHSIVEISFRGLVLAPRRSRCSRGLVHGLVACMTALTAACASGGRAPPVTGPEAAALFAGLTGEWVLDEQESSSPTDVPPPPDVEVESSIIARGPGESGQEFGDVADIEAWLARREKALEVLARWPATLVLRVDGQQLVYTPTPGESVTVPMSGEPTTQFEGDHRIHTRVVWDDAKLGLEHTVDSEAWVREILEAVDGRLIMTRTMRLLGEANSAPPLVLVYDREERES